MQNLRMKPAVGALVVALAVLGLAIPASATWSIVGVDPGTGQVGVAVASCVPISALDTDGRFELIALVADKGAGISQAAFNDDVPVEMERLLAEGSSATEIIAAVTDPAFDDQPQDRQHGVVLLNGETAGFTGIENSDFAGDFQGTDVSVQGNILVGRDVLRDALASFEASTGQPLADRLVNSLEAGSLAGGDSRCGEQTALFAHVSVIDADGDSSAPNVLSLTNWADQGSGVNPVTEMAENYRAGTAITKESPNQIGGVVLIVMLLTIPIILIAWSVMLYRHYAPRWRAKTAALRARGFGPGGSS